MTRMKYPRTDTVIRALTQLELRKLRVELKRRIKEKTK